MRYALALFAFGVVFVLAIGASAADLDNAQHIVVVGKDAPASDVVIAANFAASMKASEGVTYASSLDSEAYAALDGDALAARTVVVIDGRNRQARIIGSDDAAREYLERQGFAVRTISTPVREDLLLKPAGTQETAAQQREPQAGAQEDERSAGNERGAAGSAAPAQPPGEPALPPIEVINPSRDAAQDATPPPPATPPADQTPPAVAPEPVLVRVWHWFTRLFS